jgi:hypothetical protein
MKKVFYIILLIAELFIDAILMNLAWNNTFELASVITSIVCAALVIWQIVMLVIKKDSATRKKIMRNIALVMLLPVVAFIIMFIFFFIGLASVI